MAFDGVLINAIVNELKANFINGRIDKIHQPDKDILIISIWCKGKTQKLMLSSNPSSPRIHITTENRKNPVNPPMFCMLARKHMLGGRIVNITQPEFERIVEVHFENINEMGDYVVKKIIIECMGKHSNTILVDENTRIIDSIKHITHETSRIREVLPGRPYVYPPSQNKTNPLNCDSGKISELFNAPEARTKPDRYVSDVFTGISRTTSYEIYFLSQIEDKSLSESFIKFFEMVKRSEFAPHVLSDSNKNTIDIMPFRYKQFDLANLNSFESGSQMVEYFYSEKERLQRLEQSQAFLLKTVKANIEKLQKKLAAYTVELQSAQQSENCRLFGELITANLHLNLSNKDEVELANYYEIDMPKIIVPMDKSKSPSQNAQEYYKRYAKSKNAIKILIEYIDQTNGEIDYLESQLDNLDKCTELIELDEVRNELAREGYIKENQQSKLKTSTVSAPHRFLSNDGFEIFVGKNNMQNDFLTLKQATANDIWMHTKNIPGSHVIIKTKDGLVPQTTVNEAAMLAAFFSKAKKSSNVPVDYCPRKFVKKPRGAKPGMVTYEKYKTLYITPTEQVVKSIMESK